MTDFKYTLKAQDGTARLGEITTLRGTIRTPAFMPVGTQGTVKGMYMSQIRETGADIILGNTYHLMLRPSAERVAELGGLHKFTTWQRPILTDSGGFQVMSLTNLRKITEEAVTFKSHIDGAKYVLSPERSVEIQGLLGSDIQMQLDECVRLPAERAIIEKSMLLSLRWAERSRKAFESQPKGRALFGIVQGGDIPDLRIKSANELTQIPFEGYSIGGLAVGEPQEVMLAMLDVVVPHLPKTKPRYLMGVGTPDDLLEGVRRGVDMFDCVMPTRNGRHGTAFTRFGKMNFKNAKYATDPRPIDEASNCPAARDYSRAYIHHLFKADEMLGAMLVTWVNLAYYQDVMQGAREAIGQGRYADYALSVKEGWARGE